MQNSSLPSGGSFGPLSPFINPYLTRISAKGYATRSICDQVCILKMFGRWLKRTGREVRDLTEAVACDFLRCVSRGSYPKEAAPAALRRLLEMLRQIGATPAAKAARPSPSERLTCAYERFLFKERALSQETVTGHRCFVRRFLSEKFGSGPPNLSKLRPLDVTAFVQRHAHRHGPAQARNLVAAVRSFLRYLNYKGLVDRDLSLVVPKVACWSFSVGPKHLAPAQVRQLLHHCDRSTAVGRRDYAVLLLLTRLGLRAGEVRCAGNVENGRSCRSRRMSHEPLRVICAMIGRDAPVVECSSAIRLPSTGSKVGVPFRASSKQPWQKQTWSRHERARTCCAIVWRWTCSGGALRLMRSEKCSGTNAPRAPRSMPRWISNRCERWLCPGREVSDEASPSGRR